MVVAVGAVIRHRGKRRRGSAAGAGGRKSGNRRRGGGRGSSRVGSPRAAGEGMAWPGLRTRRGCTVR